MSPKLTWCQYWKIEQNLSKPLIVKVSLGLKYIYTTLLEWNVLSYLPLPFMAFATCWKILLNWCANGDGNCKVKTLIWVSIAWTRANVRSRTACTKKHLPICVFGSAAKCTSWWTVRRTARKLLLIVTFGGLFTPAWDFIAYLLPKSIFHYCCQHFGTATAAIPPQALYVKHDFWFVDLRIRKIFSFVV